MSCTERWFLLVDQICLLLVTLSVDKVVEMHKFCTILVYIIRIFTKIHTGMFKLGHCWGE